MAASKKPTVQFYWVSHAGEPRVNWRLVGGNGETVCESTQGFRDRSDAVRALETAIILLSAARRSGPGEKPAAEDAQP